VVVKHKIVCRCNSFYDFVALLACYLVWLFACFVVSYCLVAL
jgi:hypothetical protein